MKRSGTEEEYGQLNQLLEDIYTFRKDDEEMQKKKRQNKKQKEKEDKRKAEEMRDAALIGLGSKFYSNVSLIVRNIFFVVPKSHNQASEFEIFNKILNV